MTRVFELDSPIRDYAWGSVTDIPTLIGVEPTGRPAAELWIGAHPHSSSVRVADGVALDELLAAEPALLGAASVAEFGPRLPFLLKVLAAERALSLQVHPSAAQASAGFTAEEAEGLPADSPERNYRDAHAKPELAYALTPFDAFCGFRPPAETARFFDALQVPELAGYRALLDGDGGLRTIFTTLLSLQGAARDALIDATLAGCRRVASTDGEWASAAAASVLAGDDFPGDIGAVVALLLNFVRLAPGEAIFLGAGNVHAYLRGMCVEILANSDNVLRCGLTPKHVDVPELVRIADFTPLVEPRWQPVVSPTGESRFELPVSEFSLRVVPLDAGPVPLTGDRAYLVIGADPVLIDGISVPAWRGAFIAAGAGTVTLSGSGRAFVATTGG